MLEKLIPDCKRTIEKGWHIVKLNQINYPLEKGTITPQYIEYLKLRNIKGTNE